MRKSGFIFLIATMMLTFAGCGDSSANNLGRTRNGYGTMDGGTYTNGTYANDTYDNTYGGAYNSTTSGGAAYWDGYGVNSGRPITGDGTESRITGDVRNVGDDLADGARDIANEVERSLDGNTNRMAN